MGAEISGVQDSPQDKPYIHLCLMCLPRSVLFVRIELFTGCDEFLTHPFKQAEHNGEFRSHSILVVATTMVRGTNRNWRKQLVLLALFFYKNSSYTVGAQVLSAEQIASFHRNGFLYTKGLLPSDRIDALAAAVNEATRSKSQQNSGVYFSLLQAGGIFLPNPPNSTASANVYRDVAIHSILPSAVAELMQLDSERGDNLRLLRYVPGFYAGIL
jgi:hypothetical protein